MEEKKIEVTRCQTCGHMYSRFDIEHAKATLVGYLQNKIITNCIRCSPKNRFGSSEKLEPLKSISWDLI